MGLPNILRRKGSRNNSTSGKVTIPKKLVGKRLVLMTEDEAEEFFKL